MNKNKLFTIIHHGAVDGVTGSCHELQLDKSSSVLIDCGLFQGAEKSRQSKSEQSGEQFDFDIDKIKAVILTHVHIDHSGRIPHLLAAGYKGPIFCSQASAVLLPLVLEDAVKIGFSRDKKLIEQFLQHISKQIIALPYHKWHNINSNSLEAGSLRLKLRPAGHILGSAYAVFSITNQNEQQRVVFSGDLGAPFTPILPAPKSPYKADCLVIESTYGDKLHEHRHNRIDRLKKVIVKSLSNRGVLLIPAFSIGRTQELLYEIEQLIFQAKNEKISRSLSWNELEIIVDSPLAAKFTRTYRQLKRFWDKEAKNKLKAGRHPLGFEQLITIDSHKSHMQTVDYLAKTSRPAIVIAASGMCTGGRIVNYLKALIENPVTDIVFSGYQANGTTGRIIQQSKNKTDPSVSIDGKKYSINAGVHTIGGYSAHADQQNLINFIKRMRHKPKQIRIVHGDREAKQELQKKINSLFKNIDAIIP